MKLNIVDFSGNIIGEYTVSRALMAEYKPKLVHEYIRWQLNKRRQPIQQAKVRSDVSGAHRKIRAQKGSGRSRQGDGKACHFRGGGVAFGINPRTYEFKLNKKFRTKALQSFLSQKARNNEIIVLNDSWTENCNKTKFAKESINKISNGRSCTIVCESFENARGFNILHNVNLLQTAGINIHSCMSDLIIFDLNSLKIIEQRLERSIK